MSGSNIFCPKCISLVNHLFPLDKAIAQRTRVWCVPSKIIFYKVVDDFLFKNTSPINSVVWKSKLQCYATCIINSVERATGRVVPNITAHVFVGIGLHGNANHVTTLLYQ